MEQVFDFANEQSRIDVPLDVERQIIYGEGGIQLTPTVHPLPPNLTPEKQTLWNTYQKLRRDGKFPEISTFFEQRLMRVDKRETISPALRTREILKRLGVRFPDENRLHQSPTVPNLGQDPNLQNFQTPEVPGRLGGHVFIPPEVENPENFIIPPGEVPEISVGDVPDFNNVKVGRIYRLLLKHMIEPVYGLVVEKFIRNPGNIAIVKLDFENADNEELVPGPLGPPVKVYEADYIREVLEFDIVGEVPESGPRPMAPDHDDHDSDSSNQPILPPTTPPPTTTPSPSPPAPYQRDPMEIEDF